MHVGYDNKPYVCVPCRAARGEQPDPVATAAEACLTCGCRDANGAVRSDPLRCTVPDGGSAVAALIGGGPPSKVPTMLSSIKDEPEEQPGEEDAGVRVKSESVVAPLLPACACRFPLPSTTYRARGERSWGKGSMSQWFILPWCLLRDKGKVR